MKAYQVVAYPHLGLGLKIGRVYTDTKLKFLCQNDKARLTTLEELLGNPLIFQQVHAQTESHDGECKLAWQPLERLGVSLHSRGNDRVPAESATGDDPALTKSVVANATQLAMAEAHHAKAPAAKRKKPSANLKDDNKTEPKDKGKRLSRSVLDLYAPKK